MPADKAIFRSNPDGLQGKATQYAGKKAAQTVCNAYENGFLYCCCIKKQYSPGRREKIRALCRTGPKTHREIKQKSHLNESDGFLVGDERIELPQVESESTALPLCKSPLFGFALSTEALLTRNIIQPPPPFVNHFFDFSVHVFSAFSTTAFSRLFSFPALDTRPLWEYSYSIIYLPPLRENGRNEGCSI